MIPKQRNNFYEMKIKRAATYLDLARKLEEIVFLQLKPKKNSSSPLQVDAKTSTPPSFKSLSKTSKSPLLPCQDELLFLHSWSLLVAALKNYGCQAMEAEWSSYFMLPWDGMEWPPSPPSGMPKAPREAPRFRPREEWKDCALKANQN